MEEIAATKSPALVQNQELFGCQSLLTFRTDIEKKLKKMKIAWQDANGAGINSSCEFMEEMQQLQEFQNRVNMARAVCGNGPFIALKIKKLSEEEAQVSGYFQTIYIQTLAGKVKANSGNLFSKL